MWENPSLPPDPWPELGPWTSPGRISLAPEPSRVDRMTWDAASFAAVHPEIRVYAPWVRDLLLGDLWESLPRDPLSSARQPKWCGFYPVVDPAHSLRLIVGHLS
ncbi:hypothetical protein ACW2Q0_00640 [Nocardia sp. R16R-3T]